jgi:two-component system, response regulator PdtaR
VNHQPKVLVVEDQYFVAADCEHHLQAAGFQCSGLASTREEALRLAERQHPDLIIMDIHLGGPQFAGDEGLSAAIEIYEHLGIRCIFASAHADAAIREAASRACPIGWLDKPYTGDSLVHAVNTAIAKLAQEDRPTH